MKLGFPIRNRTGRKVFITLLREYYACHEAIHGLRDEFQLGEVEHINAAYLAFYYGAAGRASEAMLKKAAGTQAWRQIR